MRKQQIIKGSKPNSRIDRISCVRGVNRFSEVVSQPECMDRLPQSIKVVILWQGTDDLNILIFEHQLCPNGREQGITSGEPIDGE